METIAIITADFQGFNEFAEYYCNQNGIVLPTITWKKVKLSNGTTLVKVSSLGDVSGYKFTDHFNRPAAC